MKKFLLFLYIFPCFIICGCHPFAHNKNPNSQNNFSSKQSSSTRSSMESVQEEAAASTQPNKSVSSINPDTLPNKKMAWWIKREENHMTPSAQEEVDLSRYDAWYIKTNLKGDEKPVFLTFDCGYENGYTASILDVLKKHKAPGAFFLCRHYIEDQPELVKRMKKEGHIVGNHTSHHVCMPETDSRKVREEITDNANYMKEATGYEMDRFSGRRKENTANAPFRLQRISVIPLSFGVWLILIMMLIISREVITLSIILKNTSIPAPFH